MKLLMVRGKVCIVLVQPLGPMMVISDWSEFSFRELACIHDLLRQWKGEVSYLFSGYVELDIICIAVEVQTMTWIT